MGKEEEEEEEEGKREARGKPGNVVVEHASHFAKRRCGFAGMKGHDDHCRHRY
jgi:hypothetical protein